MFAIASHLDPNSDTQTREVWQLLEKDCGLAGINTTPLPHFSWQGAEDYQVAEGERILKDTAERMSPFLIRTASFGLFTGPIPVLNLALVKIKILMDLHHTLWEKVGPLARGLNRHYSPDLWMPQVKSSFPFGRKA